MNCKYFNCGRKRHAHGYCKAHYMQLWHSRKLKPIGRRSNGGKIHDGYGYVLIHLPGHPTANKGGYIREHRLTMEKNIGRPLLKQEVVHHINGNKEDNRIENLRLFANNSEQLKMRHFGDANQFKERINKYLEGCIY